jgi:ribose transport system ATP-binding protein
MLQVLFGVDPAVSGSIEVGGKTVRINSPIDAIQAGLALVPEDRKLQGLVLEMAVRTNIGLAGLKRHQKKLGFLNSEQEGADTTEMIAKLRIKTPGEDQIVQYLSGGNQQKVVLGKWLSMTPQVLLLDEPTRGIDVGAKQEIYALMEQLAEQGVAILFVSSELEEILGMSDRAIVMHEGRITGELMRDSLSEESVMHLATGNAGEESAA